MVDYWDEQRHHTEIICTYHNLSRTGTTGCTYTTSRCTKKKKKKKKGKVCVKRETDTHHVSFDLVNVIASFEWTNSTRELAYVFESYKEAKHTKFGYIDTECSQESNSSIYKFVNNLKEKKLFKCYVNPDRLGFVYLNTYDFKVFLLLLLPCLGFGALLLLFFVIDVAYRLKMEYKRRDVLFYIKCHKVRGVRWRLKVKEINRTIKCDKDDMTPLLIASKYGYHDIMEYLHSVGADLDSEDVKTGKTAFHYVCECHNKAAISWCIKKKMPIDIQDKQKRTPLITYVQTLSEKDSCTIGLGLLIDAGADVTVMDKSGSTALHYIYTNKKVESDIRTEVIRELVNAGSTIAKLSRKKSEDSPLSALLQQKQYSLGLFLIEAGYGLSSESTLTGVLTNCKNVPKKVKSQLNQEIENAQPLMRLCRTTIRKSIGGTLLEKKIGFLPIPTIIKDYIRLKESIYLPNDAQNEKLVSVNVMSSCICEFCGILRRHFLKRC